MKMWKYGSILPPNVVKLKYSHNVLAYAMESKSDTYKKLMLKCLEKSRTAEKNGWMTHS